MFSLKNTKATAANDTFVFELDNSNQVVLDMIDPPFSSKFYLKHDGLNVVEFTISPEKAKMLQKFFNSIPPLSESSEKRQGSTLDANKKEVATDSLKSKLNEIGLTKVVNKLDECIDKFSSYATVSIG
jgi:hypothetical protein